jgi:hypothetical protein
MCSTNKIVGCINGASYALKLERGGKSSRQRKSSLGRRCRVDSHCKDILSKRRGFALAKFNGFEWVKTCNSVPSFLATFLRIHLPAVLFLEVSTNAQLA